VSPLPQKCQCLKVQFSEEDDSSGQESVLREEWLDERRNAAKQ